MARHGGGHRRDRNGVRIVVTGATGNIGSQVVERLVADPDVSEVVGLARRTPRDGGGPDGKGPNGVRWVALDLTPRSPAATGQDPLDAVLAGADAVVHLAWLIQPTRDPARLWEVNVGGSERVLDAVARAGVGTVIHLSSVGAYAPAPPGQEVDETWPTSSVATSDYGLAKAYVERLLDVHEERHPGTRVVRLRPSLVVQRRAAAHVRRLFVGALVPDAAFGALTELPVVPDVPGLAVQLVHAEDVAAAVHAALRRDVRGAFNLAAPPPLSGRDLARLLGARSVSLPARVARVAVHASWAARLQPVDPGWFDLALRTPLLRTDRAAAELGWTPRWGAEEALFDVLDGLRDGAGYATPPLEGDADRSRVAELQAGRQGGSEVP
jgi:UDP-glucose 4-epimerase